MPTTTAPFVPGQRTAADAGPSTSEAPTATIRLLVPGDRWPARCNAPRGRTNCGQPPVYQIVHTQEVVRLGQRRRLSPQASQACAGHGQRFAARHGLDLPVAVS